MAHHKATLKAIRQNKKVTKLNDEHRSRIRSSVKAVEKAIAEKDAKAAPELLKNAQSELAKGVSKGVVKAGTASRKLSRLNTKVKALTA